jgi:hypothetical protein
MAPSVHDAAEGCESRMVRARPFATLNRSRGHNSRRRIACRKVGAIVGRPLCAPAVLGNPSVATPKEHDLARLRSPQSHSQAPVAFVQQFCAFCSPIPSVCTKLMAAVPRGH